MSQLLYESTETLIRRAQAGDSEAMETLLCENEALIRFVVKKYASFSKEYEDLYQLGRLGLVRAVENFDFGFSVRFSTYAVPVIMGEIRRYIRDDGQIHVSRTIKDNARRVNAFVSSFSGEGGSQPSINEIAAATGIGKEDVLLALGACQPVKSLHEPIDTDGGRLLQDTIGCDPFEKVEKNLLVRSLLESLDGKERKLIELRYFKRLTQAKTAEILGFTQVQVSRLEKKILTRLRKNAV